MQLRRATATPFVLKSFSVAASGSKDHLVRIVGRPAGLTAWLLTSMGLDAEWKLTVDCDTVTLRKASLEGETITVVPLASVASTTCGYQKPIWHFFWAAFAALASVFTLGLTLILSAVLIVTYFIQKNMTLEVQTVGGSTLGLVFRPSVIQGVAIDMALAAQAIEVINGAVVAARSRAASPGRGTTASPTGARAVDEAPQGPSKPDRVERVREPIPETPNTQRQMPELVSPPPPPPPIASSRSVPRFCHTCGVEKPDASAICPACGAAAMQ